MIAEIYQELVYGERKTTKAFIRIYAEDPIERHNLEDIGRQLSRADRVNYEVDVGRLSILVRERDAEDIL